MDYSATNLSQIGMLGSPGAAIWSRTQGYGAVQARPEYLPEADYRRHERIRVGRLLWRGMHRQAFLWEGRTQWNFPQMMVQGRVIIPYVTYNVLRLVTTTVNDLLLGEEPLLRVDGSAVDSAAVPDGQGLEGLRDRCDLHKLFRSAADQASWAGEAMAEAVMWQGRVYLQNLRPDEVYPQGPRNPDGQYAHYRRYATAWSTPSPGGKAQLLLLITDHVPGEIRRTCHLLGGDSGTQMLGEVSLELWPTKRADGSALLPAEATGVDAPLIVWMAGQEDEGEALSDYDGLIELQDELNAKQTQIARVIAKHADPKLALPPQAATDAGGSLSAYDVFYFRNKDEIPQYITWNAELAAAIEDRNFALYALHVAAEVAPVLSGIKMGAAPTAAKSLRIEAIKTVARAQRKNGQVAPFVRTCVDTALAYEDAGRRVSVFVRRAGAEGVGANAAFGLTSVQMRDGLPVDELDQANTLAVLTGAKPVMSVDRAVEILNPDPETAALELQRLRATAAAATPPILLGGLGGLGSDPTAGDPAAADTSASEGGAD